MEAEGRINDPAFGMLPRSQVRQIYANSAEFPPPAMEIMFAVLGAAVLAPASVVPFDSKPDTFRVFYLPREFDSTQRARKRYSGANSRQVHRI